MFSSADLSLAAGKMPKNWLVTGGFRYGFTVTGGLMEEFFNLASNFKGAS
jgi:hypothetical protein